MKQPFLNLEAPDGQQFPKGAMLRDLIKYSAEQVCENWELRKPALLFVKGYRLADCFLEGKNNFS